MSLQFTNGCALVIGVNENAVPAYALRGVENDISAMEAVLKHPERCGYLPERVKTLVGKNATRDGILDGIDWLAKQISQDPNTTAVVYYKWSWLER